MGGPYDLHLRVDNDQAVTVIFGVMSRADNEGIHFISLNPIIGDVGNSSPKRKIAKQRSQEEMLVILQSYVKANPKPAYHNDEIANYLASNYRYMPSSIPSMLSRFVQKKIMERTDSGLYRFTPAYQRSKIG